MNSAVMSVKFDPNSQKICPTFAYYGVNGGATAILIDYSFFRESVVLVGSNSGNCTLYSLSTSKKIADIFEDNENRQIIALGEWKFFDHKQENCGESTSSNKQFRVWIHFRGSGVEIFDLIKNVDTNHAVGVSEAIRLKFRGRISTSHYGFCRAIGDWSNDSFVLPDYEDESNIIKIRYKAGGEKCFRLDEKFLVDGFIKRQFAREESRRMTSQQIADIKPFKGMLMALKTMDDVLGSVTNRNYSDCIFVAFEDSTIALFNFRFKQIIDFLKHPKHHQFVCWAVNRSEERNGQTFFAISVMQQVYLVAFHYEDGLFEVYCVIRKTQSITCTVVEMFTDSQRRSFVACGLNSGCVEIFALGIMGGEKVTPQKVSLIDFHAGNSITCLVWKSMRNVEENLENGEKTKSDFLFVSCSGGKLSLYNL